MAARIGVAVLKADPSQHIRASEFDPDIHRGNVLCPDKLCRRELVGVQASSRTVNDEVVHVEAFFRLPSGAEKTGNGHRPSCHFAVDRTMKRLAAMSEQVTDLDPHAVPLLAAIRGKPAEFRLHILMELLPSLRTGWDATASDALAGPGAKLGTSYVRSDRFRKPYLRVAKAVLAFMARIQERPELAAAIRLKYGGHTLEWTDYFYEVGEYATLYQYLSAHQQFCRRPGKDRPVALAVEVRSRDIRQTRNGDWQILGRAEPGPADSAKPFVVVPAIYTRDEAIARWLIKEKHVLVCGVPTIRPARPAGKAWLKPSVDVSIDIVSRAQVCRYSPTLS
ncbi:hypothetical protein JMJ56_21985 [Belnapia sp. T18]|uniref:Uncharacterized protein n=1 Tax=Belnapia arida TaxID=2804533 RepID=A0ABS1U7N7_9PROT|nr:hypothetical protein [Belnapia arida]MBL6080691.1 hypothetical protein [Belnapia arida]